MAHDTFVRLHRRQLWLLVLLDLSLTYFYFLLVLLSFGVQPQAFRYVVLDHDVDIDLVDLLY